MPETAPRAGAQAGKVARGSSREIRLSYGGEGQLG